MHAFNIIFGAVLITAFGMFATFWPRAILRWTVRPPDEEVTLMVLFCTRLVGVIALAVVVVSFSLLAIGIFPPVVVITGCQGCRSQEQLMGKKEDNDADRTIRQWNYLRSKFPVIAWAMPIGATLGVLVRPQG